MQNQTSAYSGPLAGLNVVDFGHYYAGPMVGMLLADQGANVIRVIRAQAQQQDSLQHKELPDPQFRLFNRNKKLLPLDLKTEAGKAQALSLINKADVVIENFRPGVMKRLGLDYASVKKGNPGLVYLSLPGFASTDKERAHIQAWEGVMCAANGLYRDTSQYRELFDFPPVYSAVPVCSMYGGMNGAAAVMAALVAREKYGVGTVLEVPMSDGGLAGIEGGFCLKRPSYSLRALADPNATLPENLQKLRYQPGDSEAVQMEKLVNIKKAVSPFIYTIFPCSDGRGIFISYSNINHVENFLNALGVNQQLKKEGFVNENFWTTGLKNNIGGPMSPERLARYKEIVSNAFLSRTAEEWETRLQEAGAPCAMVRTRQEWMALEAMFESGVMTRMDNGKSELKLPGLLGDVENPEGAEMSLKPRDAELISAEQAEAFFSQDASVNKSSPVSAPSEDLPALEKGDLLKGIKVLDLANLLAGPICAHTLARYGAEVIKADPPDPGYYQPALTILQLFSGPGKRSIITDVKTAPGRKILDKLIGWADVVTHNILDGSTNRLGVDQASLREINPNVVSCQMTAFGGSRRGFWEKRTAFDQFLQGVTGLLAQYGSLELPEWHGQIVTADTPCGYASAFATLLGVYQQRKIGFAGETRCSLVRAATYMQLPWMIEENGNSNWGEAHGQMATGEGPCQRLYQCSDGWIFVGADEAGAAKLARLLTDAEQVDEEAFVQAFAKENCAYWQDKLTSAGVGCHQVLSIEEIYQTAKVHQVENTEATHYADGGLELLHWENHPCGYPITLPGADNVRVGENHSWLRPSAPPHLGEQTRDILRELGYSDNKIEELVKLKVSHDFYPPLGSPEAFLSPIKKEEA